MRRRRESWSSEAAARENQFFRIFVPARQIVWQALPMAKSYRTDVLGKAKFEEEIRQRGSAVKAERVPCPVPGCECTYEMYGCTPANLAAYVATLQERVQREHPDHTSEVLAVNEFRKPRR